MSDLQQEIYDFLLLHSWSNAMREFGITSKGVLKTCITRTALGYNWYPGHPGGALPYLNYAKEERLVYLIEEACRDQESPSTFEVMNLALAMRQEMIIEARNSLLKRRCLALASQLEQTSLAPTLSWLHGFNERHNLTTTSGRFVERERTLSCNKSVVLEYWLRFLPLFNRDPRLIFGADETDMRPSNHFKVVAPSGTPGLTHDEEAPKHITAMCCHSAGGASVPPFILLSQLSKLPPDLSGLDINSPDVAWFGSSERGYMTERTFYAWSVMFASWLTGYRATVLPDSLKTANILLVMDGCLAHGAPEAIRLLAKHNVTVLILPAHTSHLLQPFDVVLAAPLKASFRHFVSDEKAKLKHASMTRAAKTRSILTRAFIRAWRTVATPEACARSFEAVGIFPLAPFVVLDSPFVTDAKPVEADRLLNMKVLTDAESLNFMEATMKREKFPEMSQPWAVQEYEGVLSFLQSRGNGCLLSDPPTLFWLDNCGRWGVIRSHRSTPVPPVSPEVLLKILKRLTSESREDGEQLVHFNCEQARAGTNLSEYAVRAAATQLAKDLALKLAAQRIGTAQSIITDKIVAEVSSCLQQQMTDADLLPATRMTILNHVHDCSLLAISESIQILSSEAARPEAGATEHHE